MDQLKIGRFIASRRKQQGLTQAVLAERLGVSDKAVSKWECGRSLPDASLMLELCALLDINVNELLSGEKLAVESYDKRAEENLLALKKENEAQAKRLFQVENVLGTSCSVSYILLIFVASFAELAMPVRLILILLGAALLVVGVGYCLLIEQRTGWYECQCCHHRYVPTYRQVLFAVHSGRTRYMKCPECGRKSWQKKVISGPGQD